MRPVSIVLFVLATLVAFAAQAAHHEEGEITLEEAPAAPAAIGECAPPAAPEIPDGNTAPASDIKAAAGAVKAFVADGEAYTACLDAHKEGLGEEISDEDASALVASHNAMVDQMQAAAADFNTALGDYRAKRAAEKAEQAE